jgi:hypothetical protein
MQHLYRRRRFALITFLVCVSAGVLLYTLITIGRSAPPAASIDRLAAEALTKLQTKPRLTREGYNREAFSTGWQEIAGCDMRNRILQRDMVKLVLGPDGCAVMAGILHDDPYAGKTIHFQRGKDTSRAVQIDHIVAVSDAWQKGAQSLQPARREAFYNDPLNLLAVDGPTNMQKGDSDAAAWLPPNKPYRCRYVARQIAVKQKYRLWVTQAERVAMQRVLFGCPDQQLPVVTGK